MSSQYYEIINVRFVFYQQKLAYLIIIHEATIHMIWKHLYHTKIIVLLVKIEHLDAKSFQNYNYHRQIMYDQALVIIKPVQSALHHHEFEDNHLLT